MYAHCKLASAYAKLTSPDKVLRLTREHWCFPQSSLIFSPQECLNLLRTYPMSFRPENKFGNCLFLSKAKNLFLRFRLFISDFGRFESRILPNLFPNTHSPSSFLYAFLWKLGKFVSLSRAIDRRFLVIFPLSFALLSRNRLSPSYPEGPIDRDTHNSPFDWQEEFFSRSRQMRDPYSRTSVCFARSSRNETFAVISNMNVRITATRRVHARHGIKIPTSFRKRKRKEKKTRAFNRSNFQ